MYKKILYSLAFMTMLFTVAACSDDDDNTNKPDEPKLSAPLPEVDVPQTAGSTMTITGTGFKDDCEVLLKEEVQTRTSQVITLTITKKSSTSISFIIPEGFNGKFSLILKQEGKEYALGTITLKSNIIGTWTWKDNGSEEREDQYFIIEEGGTGCFYDDDEPTEFTWIYKDNTLTITYENGKKLIVTIKKITNNTIEIEITEDDKKEEEIWVIASYKKREVITSDVVHAALEEAVCGGKCSPIKNGTEYGICYSLSNSTPEKETSEVAKGTNIDDEGNFTVKLTGLTKGSTYHYRTYLTRKKKTYYGEVKSFRTLDIKTIGYTDTDTETAFTGQYINGNPDLTEYGICYSETNQTPTISDTKLTASKADEKGIYSVSVTNLKGDRYYYRAYIIVNGNAYYGEVLLKTKPKTKRLKKVVWDFPHDGQREEQNFIYDTNGKLIGYTSFSEGEQDSQVSFQYDGNMIYLQDPLDDMTGEITLNENGQMIKGHKQTTGWTGTDYATYTTEGYLESGGVDFTWDDNNNLSVIHSKEEGTLNVISDVDYDSSIQLINIAMYLMYDDNDIVDYETEYLKLAPLLNRIGKSPTKLYSKIHNRKGYAQNYLYEFDSEGYITRITEIRAWKEKEPDGEITEYEDKFIHEFIYE